MVRQQVRDWLDRVGHDLIKRMLWSARDCRELGRKPVAGELRAQCIDEEGQPIAPLQLWEQLREEAPEGLDLHAVDCAVRAALAAAESDDLAGVLTLEQAFAKLRSEAT